MSPRSDLHPASYAVKKNEIVISRSDLLFDEPEISADSVDELSDKDGS